MADTSNKMHISMRALVQRINRKLIKDGEQLKTARSAQTATSVGWYYILDVQRNFISTQNVDPEELGREMGVLKLWEDVVAE